MKNIAILFFFSAFLVPFSCKQKTVEPKLVKQHVIKPKKKKKKIIISDPFITKEINLTITNHLNTYFILKGEEKGLEYELIKLYAKERGFKLKLNLIHNLNMLSAELIKKQSHFASASFGIPEHKSKEFLMSDVMYHSEEVIVRHRNTNPIHLEKQKVDVKVLGNLPYIKSLLSKSFDHINLVASNEALTKQMILEQVANGKCKYTICSRNEAEIMQVFYPNLAIDDVLDKDLKIGLIFHPKCQKLKKDFNLWLAKNRNSSDFQWTLKKYTQIPAQLASSMYRKPLNNFEDEISDFDKKIQVRATEIGWDWRLMSALIFQESKFNPRSKSWVGALGLMQIMPNTAKQFIKLKNKKVLYDPNVNLNVGAKYLAWIDKYYFNEPEIEKEEKQKFIIASYNCGIGHVADARALAKKYGLNPNIWKDNVEKMILAKSEPKYFKDKVCKHGYCRGMETAKYVENITSYYSDYKNYID